MASLAGRRIVVTGAASGIGAAVVDVVLERGGTVLAVDRAAGEPRSGVTWAESDVSDETSWVHLASQLAGETVHGYVAAAGVTWRARVGDASAEAMARVYSVNVTGSLLGLQALMPLMPPGASVVMIGSLAALNGHYPVAYTTSKWAVRGLSRAASLELGPRGIRVNSVHPGFIETPMTASAPPVMRDAAVADAALGRAGMPAEVATVVAFLLSDDASYVTGAEIPVDGGAAGAAGAKPMSDALRPLYSRPDEPPAR